VTLVAGEITALSLECKACRRAMLPSTGNGTERIFKCDKCSIEVNVFYMPLTLKLKNAHRQQQGDE